MKNGGAVAAFVVPAKDAVVDEEKIRAFLSDKLAKYKIPRTIKLIETLPYTPSER